MIAVVESGASKTLWAILDNEKIVKTVQSLGLNPYIQSVDEMEHIICNEVSPSCSGFSIDTIYYYGAACSSAANCKKVNDAIAKYIKADSIQVNHDLDGAALGLWGNEQGIAMILGTGSNSCVYDGIKIINNNPAIGYILGDEGSGAHFGKILFRDYKNVYQKPSPNRWLASFAPYILSNIDNPYFNALVLNCFREFFGFHISRYPDAITYPLGVVGSVGYYFQPQLKQVCDEYGFALKKVIQSPFNDLVSYHQLNHKINN